MSDSSNLSRRSFLVQGAALSATAATGTWAFPTTAFAVPQTPSPNDRVRIGYIGVGRRAQQLTQLPEDADIVAVADVNLPRAQAVAAKWNCRAYQDYRRLLDSKDIDAVVVATPDHWHVLPSIHACQAGKDVYCEKPMSLTVHEGRVLVDAVRKYKRVFQTGTQQRSNAANQLGCELVQNGRVGKVHTIIGYNYPSPWECELPSQRVPQGLNWDMWCGPTQLRPYHTDIYTPRAKPGWISFRDYSGGEMTGWGAHGFDQIQHALQMENSGPTEVWTEGGSFRSLVTSAPMQREKGNLACSRPAVFFRYASGAVLKLQDGPRGGGIFMGDEGKLTVERGLVLTDEGVLAVGANSGSKPVPDATRLHLQNWIDCIKSRERPIADVEIGHRSATVCHLGNIARWLGRKLHWNPQAERFVGDVEADALLTRPPRKGYELPLIT